MKLRDERVEKSDHRLTPEQAMDRVLKTERGRDLWAAYNVEGDSLSDLAKEQLAVRAAKLARAWQISKSDALIEAARENPGLAVAAGLSVAKMEKQSAAVAKGDGESAWDKIEALANARVEKSEGAKALSFAQAVDRVLKSREGQELYAKYMEERYAA